MRREHLWEAMWVALGLALGILPACATAIYEAYIEKQTVVDGVVNQRSPLGVPDLVQIVILAVAVAIFGILCWVMRGKGKSAVDLAAAIRERTKHRVAG